MAVTAGVGEDEVLALLRRLKEEKVIRRFGASVKHQKAGFSHNAMVAWRADEALAEAAGPLAAEHPLVSHCYYRPIPADAPPELVRDWDCTLYTMIHGRSEEECADVVAHLLAATPLREYRVLKSLRELKKISMSYF